MTQTSVTQAEATLSQPVHRLPLTAMAASLIALAAFYATSRDVLLLPAFSLALVATYLISYRIPNKSVMPWILRFALFGFILFVESDMSAGNGVDTLLDARTVNLFGLMCAAELTIQCWKERPDGGNRGGAAILLSGLIFLAGCNTFQEYIRFFAPAYMLLLALTFSGYQSRRRPVANDRRRNANERLRVVLSLLPVLLGGMVFGAFTHYRAELTSWGARSINMRMGVPSIGLSASPVLGSTFGMRGSPIRVLRIEGPIGESHLRAMAFDRYGNRMWRPSGEKRNGFEPASRVLLRSSARGKRTHVTRLKDDDLLVFSPLNVMGIDVGEAGQAEWNPMYGGPVRTEVIGPTDYTYIVNGDAYYQGPLCTPPTPEDRERLLIVPEPDIDPRVKVLARQIAGKETDPLKLTDTVSLYLMTHHHYSLRTDRGVGDPISNFILSDRAAHCEYFASAAVILLRCLGIPSRYVIGYYAHESAGPNITVVRSQDAHAWAESWVEGTGWVMVDATPGDGRPDKLNAPTAWITRLMERLTDVVSTARAWLSTLTPRQLGEMMTFMAVLMVVPTLIRILFASRKRVSRPGQYVISDAEMARLALRFESVLKRVQHPCPPGRPWSEHLAQLVTESDTTERPGLDWSAAETFVGLYNALRFGAADRERTVPELDRQLRTLEQAPQPKAQ